MATKLNKSSSKFSLGIAMLTLGAILVFGGRSTNIVTATFETEPVSVEGFESITEDAEKIPVRIVIPSVSIDLDVKKAEIVGGYWEVFENIAGWGEDSGLPGESGNQVIFAHVREGLFLPLRDIELDDQIYVFTKNEWYSYTIAEMKEVYPDQIEVISPTEDETLTLYTCSGFKDSKRLIVTAKRI